MSTNIAEIGFAADSSQLKSAKAALDSLSPSAHTAERAAEQLATGLSKAQAAAAGMASTSKTASAAMGAQEGVTHAVALAQGRLSVATVSVANAEARLSKANASLAMAVAANAASDTAASRERLERATLALATAEARLGVATANAAAAQDRAAAAASAAAAATAHTATAADQAAAAQQRMGAATAAAASHAQGMQLNTANLAAQFQDIGVTAAMGMNPLMIAMQQGTQISAVLAQNGATAASVMSQLGGAFRSIVSPVALATIGIIGVLAALVQMVPWSKVAAASLRWMADMLDKMRASIVAAMPVIVGFATAFVLWNLPAIVAGVVSLTAAIVSYTAASVVALATNPFTAIPIAIGLAMAAMIAFRKQLENAIGAEYVQKIKGVVNTILGMMIGTVKAIAAVFMNIPTAAVAAFNITLARMKEFANGILIVASDLVKKLPSWLGGSAEGIAFRFDASANLAAASKGGAAVGTAVSDAMKGAMGTDWVGTISTKVGEGVTALSGKFRKWADALGGTSTKYKKLTDDVKNQIAMAKLEQDSIGMSAERAAILREQMTLLNKAKEDGIKLTPQMTRELMGFGETLGRVKTDTEKLREAFDFSKDVVSGFVHDLKDGLKNGEGFFKSFLNAITNVLDKITNKLIDMSVDMLFTTDKGGASSGILGSLVKYVGTAIGAPTGGTAPTQAFAKGGVVHNPTMFAFANGGRVGLMGEAGSEAIMPLKRGPDGSLGVQMHGASNDNNAGGPSVVVIVENNAPNTNVREESSRGSDGREMRRIIIDQMRSGIASGEMDGAMKARYGNAPMKTVRG